MQLSMLLQPRASMRLEHSHVIPYTGSIPGGLHTGEIIIVQGTVPPDADRFHIDLSSGCSTKPCSDIAMRFNACFEGTPSVTCNSLTQERWGQEQTLQQLPYKQGAPFETIILVHEDVFKSLPYKGSILKGLKPGQHITIKGQVSMYPHSFTVNLRNSRTENIALHLNPRIKSGVFIRNSYLGEAWGYEERELPFFPFSPGEYFEILMLCQPHQFKLAVNGCHLLEFRHRVQDLSSIDQLEIMGDLELSDVKLW
ncbi:galectin-8 [Gadus chalcogrammus]|uniref:galectin-8 n=1 Tax=Gadus chalcogrammus TaxID=1042646 RepID=UPI0024C331AB|nr:galectin-8 [Gadus chalcogrammus]